MKDFGAQVKQVGGGEGDRCQYNYRLDTYGCGCQHDCSYCYAKSLLDFRKLWDADNPRIGKSDQISKQISKIPRDEVIRLGGMTDCMMPLEKRHRVTYQTIKKLQRQNREYLIVTKSHIVTSKEYLDLYDPDLAHFQISITSTDDDQALEYERASLVSKRLESYKILQDKGFDVSLRVSPYIPSHIDWSLLEGHKLLVEFLRVNQWIEKWLPLDYSRWTLSEGGYKHMQLSDKIEMISHVRNFDEISVCEDVDSHYEYWKNNLNANKDDCCNLRRNRC